MKQLHPHNFFSHIEKSVDHPVFIYFETPLCGTCKMGKKMLDVAVETLESQTERTLDIASCNLNELPMAAQTFGITSVPCFIVFSRGIVLQQIYALQSASYLYTFLQQFTK